MSSNTSTQSALEPQHEKQIVRLSVQRFADVWSVDCEVCHKVLFKGTPSDYNLTVESIVRTAAALHRHS